MSLGFLPLFKPFASNGISVFFINCLIPFFFDSYAMQNGKQMVQEGALTALASVADSSQVLYSSMVYIIDPFMKCFGLMCSVLSGAIPEIL